jgi:hypothetical protein
VLDTHNILCKTAFAGTISFLSYHPTQSTVSLLLSAFVSTSC